MRIVDEAGAVVSDTFWRGRRNNYTDLASLLLANTVTGAASLFRRELLDLVLPFPEPVGDPFHDQWIAAVALATGSIAYVDRPLYDYVQHGGAARGHEAAMQRVEPRAALVSWRRPRATPARGLRAREAGVRDQRAPDRALGPGDRGAGRGGLEPDKARALRRLARLDTAEAADRPGWRGARCAASRAATRRWGSSSRCWRRSSGDADEDASCTSSPTPAGERRPTSTSWKGSRGTSTGASR